MKRAKILGAMLFLVGGACGEPEETEEIAPIGEPASAVAVPVLPGTLPAPLHGGTVLMAGQRPIEVVADRAGAFNAYHLGAPPAAPQDARVTVRVPDADGQTRPVLLTWNPNESRYTGLLRGAQPVAGPLELVYVLGSETARASAPTFVLLEAAQAATGLVGAPGAVTPVVVERPSAPNIVVQAPSAPPPPQIVVQAPQPPPPPHIVVQGPQPPPPPRIVVQAPPPPQVVVRPPAPPPPPRVVVQAPPPPRVVVATPRPPPPPRVVVQPPPPPRVVVRPPAPPPPPRVVVTAPPPPPRVVVRPAPPPRVEVRRGGEGEEGRGRGGRGEGEERRGHGHGDRNHRHTGPGGRGR